MFANQAYLMKNLINTETISTQFCITYMIITYDSKKVITITKRKDSEYWIK